MTLRTALYEAHQELGATFTPFAGYDMPVHYGSIKEEHHAVRQHAGLFDVSHMSNLLLSGPGAAAALSAVCPFDAAALEVGRGKYTVVLRDDGTILDDAFCFRTGEESFEFIPNAGMNEAVADHLTRHAPRGAGMFLLDDASEHRAILAFQGPAARDLLATVIKEGELPRFHRATTCTVAGQECLVTGTGYTGEKGVELYLPATGARAVWDALAGLEGVRPIGLGARDTLRLEKGYCLAGHEFEGGRTPLEAGLGFVVDWDQEFLGKAALQAQRASRDHDRLVALTVARGVPRQGMDVVPTGGGDPVGTVTSGTMSPSLGHGIALAYVAADAPDELALQVRQKVVPAQRAKLPFVPSSS
ncbi:MAG: glycine cleavage system aminomethyltransferase GcvT [Thermoplasmatota archaeon]